MTDTNIKAKAHAIAEAISDQINLQIACSTDAAALNLAKLAKLLADALSDGRIPPGSGHSARSPSGQDQPASGSGTRGATLETPEPTLETNS